MNSHKPIIALLGNPNVGKTAVFNLLTGLDQKVSNYPGITVEKKTTQFKLSQNHKSKNIIIEDFPGSYSIIPQSLDEELVCNSIYEWIRNPITRPDAIIYVADCNNIRRNLYFLSQLMDVDLPIILLLNMDDILEDENKFDYIKLKNELNLYDIIPFSTINSKGVHQLKKTLSFLLDDTSTFTLINKMELSESFLGIVKNISTKTKSIFNSSDDVANQIAFRLLCNPKHIDDIDISADDKIELKAIIKESSSKIDNEMIPLLPTLESDLRYGWIDELLLKCQFKKINVVNRETKSEKIDKVLTHPLGGPLIFVGILYIIFLYIFEASSIPMDYIENEMSLIMKFISKKSNFSAYSNFFIKR